MNTLKLDFQNEKSKPLSDFSNLKALKNKLENKLYTQGQSIQTAQMMQNHIWSRDRNSRKGLGMPKTDFSDSVKNTQPALYDANEMLKPNHTPLMCGQLRRKKR